MTKPVTRKMAVDCLLDRFSRNFHVLICGICKCVLAAGQPIQFDHVHADVFDGPHEYQNLRPVHTDCHKKKTKADIQANAKIKRLTGKTKSRKKVKMPSRKLQSGRKLQSRPFQKKAK